MSSITCCRLLKIFGFILLTSISISIVLSKANPILIQISGPDNTIKSNYSKKTTHMIPGKLKNFEKALERMNDTNNLIINWAILLLGGIIAITITPKSENIKDDNWGLLFISPILVFLCASLYFASIYKQALTFQTATSRYNFPILNDVLYVQVLFFKYGLIPLLLFSLWYLIWRLLKIRDIK